MKKNKTILSKSKVMMGLQCERALWLQVHRPKLARQVTQSEQAVFDQGHDVGFEAQKRYPGGVLIDAPYWDFQGALDQTKKAINEGVQNIYEASFMDNDIFARIDILNFNKGAWDLIEVKSSTSVKDEHIFDVALQKIILESSGLNIGACYVMHINNQCVAPDLENLFLKVDVTERVDKIKQEVSKRLPAFKETLLSARPPNIDIGPHCGTPYECRFKDHCWTEVKLATPSIFELPRLGDKVWEFYSQGKLTMSDIDENELNETQRRAVKATLSNELICNKEAIKKELSSWEFPLYFLDFETIGYAVPNIRGTRPYEQIPFQYSLHVQNEKQGELIHHEYLNTKKSDPRYELASALVRQIGPKGSVVAYNKGFEAGVLNKLSEIYPDLKESLLNISSRLVDPLPLFRNYVYHSGFRGSFSIKSVAPALLGEKVNYSSLDVSDGALAQVAYKEMVKLQGGDPRKEKIKKDLLKYCELDTLSMADLVSWLFSQEQSE